MLSKLSKPSWFLVEKYDEAKFFSANDWLEQISVRFLLYILPQAKVLTSEVSDLFEDIQNQIYPKSNIGVLALKQLVIDLNLSLLDDEIAQQESLLHNIDEIITLYYKNNDIERISNELTERFESKIENFEPIEKIQTINENQQKRWSMHRVLAYVDLILWCKVNNYEIKNHGDVTFTELTQWVFDDRNPHGISRSQLKNVKKYESEMMNESFLIQLYKYSKAK